MFPVKHILQLFQLIPFWLMLSTVWAVGNDLGNGVVSGKYFWFYLSIGLTAATVALSRIFSRTSFRFVRLDA
ncbi:MAG: hypothetical protein LBL04_15055, partial [Bacteroidales bacterium]|nr:hypothetical protein [Bacteroidales bacterium]